MLPGMVHWRRPLMWFLIPVVMPVAGCGGGRAQETACDFRGKLPPGRQCVYQLEVREETSTRAPGSVPIPSASMGRQPTRTVGRAAATSVVETVWQTVEVNFSVRDEPEDGEVVADFVIVSATVEQEQRVRSGPPRMIRRKLDGVTGARVVCRADSDGAVENVEGTEEFMRQVIGDGPLASETVAGVLNEDFLRQMRITGWKYLPDGPAAPGYAWTTTDRIEFPGIGRIMVRQRHRFEKWERGGERLLARISWWGSVGNVIETAAADEVLPDTVRKVESVGWCLFSPSLGMVVEWAEDLTVLTELELPDQPRTGGEATQEIHRRIGVKLAVPVIDSRRASGRLLGDKKASAVRKTRRMEKSNAKGGLRLSGEVSEKTGGGG